MRRRQTFRRCHRLRLQRDFRRVFGRRCSASDAYLVVYVDRNDREYTRLGIQTSRKVGTAVVRNRLRRLVREAYRLSRHDLPDGIDILCVVRPSDAPRLSTYLDRLPRLVRVAVAKLNRQKE